MHDCCCSANLPPLFSDGSLPKDVEDELWPAFQEAFQSDNRGTRLNDILAFGHSAAIQVCLEQNTRTKKIPENICSMVAAHFGCQITGQYFVNSPEARVDMKADVKSCSKLRMDGVVFHAARQVPKDSNVIINIDKSSVAPAQIQSIYAHGTHIAVAIQRYLPLSDAHLARDYYRPFGFQVAGALYYRRLGDTEIVSAENIISHFAKTPFVDPVIGDHIHVLPLAKVSLPTCSLKFTPY